jgi:uncharacterized membrane protein YfcA
MSPPKPLPWALLCVLLLPILGQAQEAGPPAAPAPLAEPGLAPVPPPSEPSLQEHVLASLLGGTMGAVVGGALGYVIGQPWRICLHETCQPPSTTGILTGLSVAGGTVLGGYAAHRALGAQDGFEHLVLGATLGSLAGIVIGNDLGSEDDPRIEVLAASIPAAVALSTVAYGVSVSRRKPSSPATVQFLPTVSVTREGAVAGLVGRF